MEEACGTIRYLGYEEIVNLNKRIIAASGGYYASVGIPANSDSLHYLIEIVQGELDGHEIFSSLAGKAAVYAFNIITRHVFADGNKRTGIASMLWFLRLNGQDISVSDDEIVELSIRIANSEIALLGITAWIQSRMD